MIRFGPAGIPLSCKGRTLKDGIEDVHNLSLTALEIQMVRAGTIMGYPEEEDVGLTIKDIQDRFVIEIIRDDEPVCDTDEPIMEDDVLVWMPSGISESFGDLYDIGKMARRLDVSLSMHTPYYMDLGSNSEITGICFDSIRHAGRMVNALGGDIVVTSLGLYGGSLSKEETDANISENLEALMDWWQEAGIETRLGIEVSGHQNVFGSLDQILELCDSIDGLVPVINFPHLHARTNGSLMEQEDFMDVLGQVEPYCAGGRVYTAFAGVEHADGNERKLTPIKKGDLRFEPLAEALTEMKPEATVISGSPLLEHDAVYMRVIHERVLTKRATKALKAKKKEEADSVPSGGE
ncbi:MAG: TIM barrel protein [Candidatus Methanomethylophilaceae archaeon]|jgi:deoxyribonuclease-4|nr:TIM barrel protein [Candidatus Methanomethylophilaceae archaeon]NLF34217.1 TIM barrel protein [Thermoplasmatales archaeon]